uniref:chemokine-like factor isoform X1 n=1 Tax=Jaculus jaculus TaxID=51337 RepID=UPI001E1B1EC9|nr:chemokine-like factor isoform X1 [Jaculus jaculus]
MESSESESPFCFSLNCLLKTLRLVVTVLSMIFFIMAQAPEPFIVVTGFEATVVLFFIILYTFKLDQMMKWLFWPLFDVINSMVATLFMIIVSILAMITDTKTYILLGGVCGLLAVVCTIADGALIYRKLRRRPSEPYEKDTSRDESEES